MPQTLGELSIKSNEVLCLDSGTTLIDAEFCVVTGDLRPRATILTHGDECTIFFSSLMNKTLKVIFPDSYIHSFSPGEMHDHFVRIFNELRDAQAIPGDRPENLKSASQDMSQFDRGVHQGISEVYRFFMKQIDTEIADLLCLNKQLRDLEVPIDNIRNYAVAVIATCGLID